MCLHVLDYNQKSRLQTVQSCWFFSPGQQETLSTYLCSDHDDFKDLHSQLPGQMSSGPVLLTRAHKVVLQVISQFLLVHNVLSCS